MTESSAPPLSAEEIAHIVKHLGAGCTRVTCRIGSFVNCYDGSIRRKSEPLSPDEFIEQFFGPRLLETFAAKDAEIAELMASIKDYDERIGELEVKNAELKARLEHVQRCRETEVADLMRQRTALETKMADAIARAALQSAQEGQAT